MRDDPAGGDGFGTLLRRHRLAALLSQEDLAWRCGLSVRAIADMERGRTSRPRRSSVLLLADALGLTGAERELLGRAARPQSAGLSAAALSGPAAAGPAAARSTASSPAAGSAFVPRQLPAAVPHFAGRSDELKALSALLDSSPDSGGTVIISAIAGTAGVGKTTLAVHWAHEIADRFPDGQLYVNLRGFDPSGEPVPPAEATRGFLDALGISGSHRPATPQAQAGLYRSMLADRRMLIVLDNARDAAQVRPLLPGSAACLVIVTSRSQLAGLVAAEDASPLSLDVLTPADAAELLSRRLGPERVAAEPAAVTELIGLCARLPLALAVVAAQAAMSPALPLRTLADDLSTAASRLDAMETGEVATSLRAVFSWSCQLLTEPAARMFALLGLHPGPSISAAAAASLAGVPPEQAGVQLAELARCHLVTGLAGSRFACHDMLRAYAAEQAAVLDSESARRAALHRALDHYLHTARTAEIELYPLAKLSPVADPQPGATPEQIAGHEQAMAWFDAEHKVLLGLIDLAARAGFDVYARQIPSAMTVYLDRRGFWADYATTQQAALEASQRMADLAGQAKAYLGLSHISTRLGSFGEAGQLLGLALDLFRQLNDGFGQARVHLGFAFIYEQQGRYADSLTHCQQASCLYELAGNKERQANCISNVGWCHSQLGNYQKALESCAQAMVMYRELSDRHGEASTWDTLGYAHHHLGNYDDAAACHRKGADLFAEYGDRYGQGVTLSHLGDTHLAAGHPDLARQTWQQALAILDDMPQYAAPVRVKLQQLDER